MSTSLSEEGRVTAETTSLQRTLMENPEAQVLYLTGMAADFMGPPLDLGAQEAYDAALLSLSALQHTIEHETDRGVRDV